MIEVRDGCTQILYFCRILSGYIQSLSMKINSRTCVYWDAIASLEQQQIAEHGSIGMLIDSLEQQQIAEHVSIEMLIASLEQQQISNQIKEAIKNKIFIYCWTYMPMQP